MAVEKYISNMIETQFPQFYRDEGPVFVDFVKKYYEWMETSNNTLYHTRRQPEYKDIDETVDDFVVKFKEKYLKNIQLETVSQTRQLVKHGLDLYRSKGTKRSVDLFFRSVFGEPAEVYYPGSDIFRLSDGKWIRPTYLEVTPSPYNTAFVGKQIVGMTSGATCFVERYIRRKFQTKYVDILYISAIVGEFETGEKLSYQNEVIVNNPTIIGSLTTLQIITGSFDFNVGDIVELLSDNGVQGKARVTSISNIVGAIDFDLIDSGWGFTANADVLISEKIITISGLQSNVSLNANAPFVYFENLIQPIANISYINANATITPAVGDKFYTYYANNDLAGEGAVLEVTTNGNTNGTIRFSVNYGNLAPVQEASANLSGNVAVSHLVGVMTGIASIDASSSNVVGTGTSFNTETFPGAIIELVSFDDDDILQGREFKRVNTVVNSTFLTIDSNAAFTSTNTFIYKLDNRSVIGDGTAFDTDFDYGDFVAIYSAAGEYTIYSVNSVVNATFMSVQSNITFSNSATKHALVVSNNKIYTESNVIVANIFSYTDLTATGNVIGSSSNLTLSFTNTSGLYTNNSVLFQLNPSSNEIANATITRIGETQGANAEYFVTNAMGIFVQDNTYPVYSRFANGTVSNVTATLSNIGMTVGVIDIENSFIASNAFVYGSIGRSNGYVTRVSQGTLASFGISPTLQFPETITIPSDFIYPYENMPLNLNQYGFPKYPTANLDTEFLVDILAATSYEIGGVSGLISVNPGKDYDAPPFILIYEPIIAVEDKKGYSVEIEDASGSFTEGELITQTNGATGKVRSSNDTIVVIDRLKYDDMFEVGEELTGELSGTTANVISISVANQLLPIGMNAIVGSNVQVSSGAVAGLEVVDSGFGYLQGEVADFISADGERVGSAKVVMTRKGISEGFYRDKNGFISDDKKLHDGEYYQEFSYEIQSAINVDKYTDMLKKVIHVAGTKAFSQFVIIDTAPGSPGTIISDIVEE